MTIVKVDFGKGIPIGSVKLAKEDWAKKRHA